MSIYLAFLRLHLLWFILYNLVCIPLAFLSPNVQLILLIKLVGYLVIWPVTRPFNKKYDYYFKNNGYSSGKLFLIISLIDLILFSVLIIPLKLLI